LLPLDSQGDNLVHPRPVPEIVAQLIVGRTGYFAQRTEKVKVRVGYLVAATGWRKLPATLRPAVPTQSPTPECLVDLVK